MSDSEAQARRKFKTARRGVVAGVRTKNLSILSVCINRLGVETNGIRHVEGIGAQLQIEAFSNFEVLVDASVNVKEAVAPEVVALTGFARVCVAKISNDGLRVA